MLTIVSDSAIPLVKRLLSPIAKLVMLPQERITNTNLRHADALLVRSVTRVDEKRLKNTSVKFVGSLTAGLDHLDIPWLKQQNIYWTHSQGANAQAVAQYVICCVAFLQKNAHLPQRNLRAGIIGHGHVGSKVAAALKAIGAEVLINDPPLAQKGMIHSTPLAEFVDLDLISLHTPLTHDQPFATFHLVNDQLLRQQKKAVLINTSRGDVVDCAALSKNPHINFCFDVWPNEPNVDWQLVQRALLATPHIAGYSQQAKYLASIIIFEKLIAFFKLHNPHNLEKMLQENSIQRPLNLPVNVTWQDIVLQTYNPDRDSQTFKKTNHSAEDFQSLRNQYTLRTEFSAYHLPCQITPLLKKLGFKSQQSL